MKNESKKENVLDILRARGYVRQVVFEDELRKLLDSKSVTFYTGYDPTADSLHIGHFLQLMAMSHLQRCGHRPIIVLGGGTAAVGDPSGKTEMRKLLDIGVINGFLNLFKEQVKPFLSFEGENGAIIVNNADWLLKLNYVEFIRDIGAHFSVNRMLTAESYRSRIEKGLTFLEFNYQIMQAYDFLILNERYDCELQLGGDDQWSNILAGADLIRRIRQRDAYAVTFTLLEKSNGEKMGKTAGGAIWLDPKKTSPYDFYQYFRNVEDVKVEECLKLLTFLPLKEIAGLAKYKDERINEAKKVLAFEVTKLVHGEAEALKAQKQAAAAFSNNLEDMPKVSVRLAADYKVVDLLCDVKLCASKGEARRLIEGGGVNINDCKVLSVDETLKPEIIKAKTFILHKGKKIHLKINLV
jgi:tyrosyl-tRNA synthetase